jgi:hypothetical protein
VSMESNHAKADPVLPDLLVSAGVVDPLIGCVYLHVWLPMTLDMKDLLLASGRCTLRGKGCALFVYWVSVDDV